MEADPPTERDGAYAGRQLYGPLAAWYARLRPHRYIFLAAAVLIAAAALLRMQPRDGPLSGLLYEKRESWGPCPPETMCRQTTALGADGRLVLAGNQAGEYRLSPEDVERVAKFIQDTGVLDASCPAPAILDYEATYRLTVHGKTKTIVFPGCEEDLVRIDSLIGSFAR